MADNCEVAVGGILLDPSCEALKSPGGVKKDIFIGSIAEVAGFTIDATTKAIKTIDLVSGAKLGMLKGRKLKNSTSTGLERNENVDLFPHNVNVVAYAQSQLDKETIETLSQVEDLFAIVQNNNGTFEAFGLAGRNGTIGNGLLMSALEHSSGVALTDGSPWTLNFSGSESKLPMNVELGADAMATLAALRTMHTTAAA